MSLEFLHIGIDLSLRRVNAPDGNPIIICQVDSNVPIMFYHEDPSDMVSKGLGKLYSFGRSLDTEDAFYLEIMPFMLIIKRCADCMYFCVIAHNDVEDSIYSIKRIENGEVVDSDTPNGFIGKVSKGNRYEFDLLVGKAFRIETIPSEDPVLGKSKIVFQSREEQEDL